MERDVVCGMQVDPSKAAGTSQYNGKTYYFCSTSCKTKLTTTRHDTPSERPGGARLRSRSPRAF